MSKEVLHAVQIHNSNKNKGLQVQSLKPQFFFFLSLFSSIFSWYVSANTLNVTELSYTSFLYDVVVCVNKTQFATVTTTT